MASFCEDVFFKLVQSAMNCFEDVSSAAFCVEIDSFAQAGRAQQSCRSVLFPRTRVSSKSG